MATREAFKINIPPKRAIVFRLPNGAPIRKNAVIRVPAILPTVAIE